jgi:uncharacterized repeat protein (TIGR03803 family)
MTKLRVYELLAFALVRRCKGEIEGQFSFLKMAGIVLAICASAAIASAQTVTTLTSFDVTNGADPFAGLVQGTDGNFYGTTQAGGASGRCTNGCGTVFKITAAGTLTTLHSFDSTDGSGSEGGLVLGTDGNFYGTTYAGGANGDGTVFKITPAGTLTTLHTFGGADGRNPASSLVQATNGNFYGTTNFGGASNNGTVFKMTAAGTLTPLHSFDRTDGFIPSGGLVQATNGNFYGTTLYGGENNYGTVFEITNAGTLTSLHSFADTDGAYPFGGLVQGTDRNFYGTTNFGGTGTNCQTSCGTIFKITAGGTLTTLYNFNTSQGPYGPYGGLVQGTDGNFYGTTQANMVFQITPAGVLTPLFTFNYVDGFEPLDALVQGTNGNFYGTTYQGAGGYGTVFSLSMGLGPFVKTLPAAGELGAEVGILGTNLTGASGVAFNGTTAPFKVISPTLILTHVPAGAMTGTITVTLPGSQTLSSNVPFYVLR